MFATAHLRSPRRDRALLAASLLGLAAIAGVAIWAVGTTPYGRYLQHDTPVGGTLLLQVGLFTVGWLVMIAAMMLPTSIPFVLTFAAIVSRRSRSALLVGLLISGYLLIWSAFGFGAWVADRGIHAAVDSWPWLAAHPQLIMATTLGVAGLWQFSPLRDRCLDECRSPLGFVMNRWRGTSPAREAILMGIAHGAFCVGCCWSLMLVMFGIGMTNLPAMFVLGGLTAIEKNMPWGRRLTRPVGVVLVLAGVYALTP
jgi:predicted metal-binding membrane protein